MMERGEGRPARDVQPGEVIGREDAAQGGATASSQGAGLSTADLAGRTRDADRDGVPDTAQRPGGAGEQGAAPLFDARDAEAYRARWTEVQTGFVDDPRHAVEQADGLVAEVMKRLAEVFADERANLEQQWSRGQEADTESLRVALRRYRSFFDRLLSV